MASWAELELEAPDLAAAIKARFVVNKHHVLATLRRDGSPRVSGIEVQFEDWDVFIGSMGGSKKAADLIGDPRFAIHAGPTDEMMTGGDAKIAGVATEVPAPDTHPGSHRFKLSIDEAVLTGLNERMDHLVIQIWRPGQPVRRVER
ncbi:MAG: pyridoxamine 5'-phosphate oxidase family protein [Actinomycetota bacterium]